MTKTRWKFLEKKGRAMVSTHGNLKWKIGEWQTVDGNVRLCGNGLHCSKKIYEAFSYVAGGVLAKVEVRGEHADSEDKEAWSEMRIIKAYKWTKADSVALSIYAAELCIKEYEKLYPNDSRPRDAIEAAKVVLLNDTPATRKKASAAESAAWSAWSAAWSARSAAWSAAGAKKRTVNKIEKWFNDHIEEMEEIK